MALTMLVFASTAKYLTCTRGVANMMTDEQDFNRMRWASRRGLLELDLLLAPFVEACYQTLDEHDKAAFRRLVAEQDQDIINWIMGREPVRDPALTAIVAQIRAHNDAKLGQN